MTEDSKEGPSRAVSKEELELQKLQLEIMYSRRGFRLQLANFVTLVAIALTVFYFFQRPQVQTMEAARLATEKHQVAQLVIAALGISGDAERARILVMLAEQYPHFAFVGKIATNAKLITEASARGSITSPASRDEASQDSGMHIAQLPVQPFRTELKSAAKTYNKIDESIQEINAQLQVEQSRGSKAPSDQAARGALTIALALAESRRQELESKMAEERARHVSVPTRSVVPASPPPPRPPRYEWLPNETKPNPDATPVILPPAVGLD
ncbi:hypothetical protein [Rhodopseudomonas sp. B29]|uniref:hypothetical protein n=1 Tax=Rhodopseudomonas sp. B29 TaxID=95607 RepID=UPI0011D26729|nr:hypothetical protein [Rhodopseudomonas sp. B29]